MDKKVRKVRGFANIRYNAKITENLKHAVFQKIMLNLKICQNLIKIVCLRGGYGHVAKN